MMWVFFLIDAKGKVSVVFMLFYIILEIMSIFSSIVKDPSKSQDHQQDFNYKKNLENMRQ